MEQFLCHHQRWHSLGESSFAEQIQHQGGEDGAVTTVTFEEKDGATRVVVHELYSSKEALDDALASGSTSGCGEQFEQLDDLVVILDAEV